MLSRLPIVAIDGPSGAGKSTIGKRLAMRLGFRYIDTGALYRAVALTAKEQGLSLTLEEALAAHTATLSLGFEWLDGENRVLISGQDRTQEVRSEAIGLLASKVSALPRVREALLMVQRNMGSAGGVVMDGRDIGTVIFPDAEVKCFLSASAETRAKRRYDELVEKGQSPSLEKITADLLARDKQDQERKVAPLKQAPDAELLDSTHLTIEEVVDRLEARVRRVMAGL